MMSVTNDPTLQQYNVNYGLQPNGFQSQLDADLDSNGFGAFALNSLANASVNSAQHLLPRNKRYPQTRANAQLLLQPQSGLQPRQNSIPNAQNGGVNGVHHSPTQPQAQPFSNEPWRMDNTSQNGTQQQQHYYTPIRRLQQEEASTPGSSTKPTPTKADTGGHFTGMKLIPHPPDLLYWRERLFNITTPITMSEDDFQTYFPHVDNVYSHRSTQKYKRKPFVCHYWDCRLKGRPPGTPKSNDPSKKKRKRSARERDLCDVKIKITEYFTTDESANTADGSPTTNGNENGELTFIMENEGNQPPQSFGMLAPPATSLPPDHPGAGGKRYFTIQRVNGNAGGDKEDGEGLEHKHTLESSDQVKKNSVQRWLLKEEKEKKRQQQLETQTTKSTTTTLSASSSPLSLRSTGLASTTMKRHHTSPTSTTNLTLFLNAFCPFAQRVWIALEVKQIHYRLVEIVPNRALQIEPPRELLEVCPDGAIPCIRQQNWGIWESGVMMEYLEDLEIGLPLLPPGKAQLRAHCRLWVDHINRKILPPFYALLLTPPAPSRSNMNDTVAQLQQAVNQTDSKVDVLTEHHQMLITTLQTAITALVNASHQTGPFFLGDNISFVDIAFAPWIIRLSRVLSKYRNFPRPEVGTRWNSWVDAIESDDRVRATVSDEGSYHNVYGAVGEEGYDAIEKRRRGMVEADFARKVMREEGFGLGGDVWGRPGGGNETLPLGMVGTV